MSEVESEGRRSLAGRGEAARVVSLLKERKMREQEETERETGTTTIVESREVCAAGGHLRGLASILQRQSVEYVEFSPALAMVE